MEVFMRSLDSRDGDTVWPYMYSNMGNSLRFRRMAKTDHSLADDRKQQRPRFLRLDSTGESMNDRMWDPNDPINSSRRTRCASTADTVIGSVQSVVQQLCQNTARYQPYLKTQGKRITDSFQLQGLGLTEFCQEFLNKLNLDPEHCSKLTTTCTRIRRESMAANKTVPKQENILPSPIQIKEPIIKDIVGSPMGDASQVQVSAQHERVLDVVTEKMSHESNTNNCELVSPNSSQTPISSQHQAIPVETEIIKTDTVLCENLPHDTCQRTWDKVVDSATCDSRHGNNDITQRPGQVRVASHVEVSSEPNVQQIDILHNNPLEINSCCITTHVDLNNDKVCKTVEPILQDPAMVNQNHGPQLSDNGNVDDRYHNGISECRMQDSTEWNTKCNDYSSVDDNETLATGDCDNQGDIGTAAEIVNCASTDDSKVLNDDFDNLDNDKIFIDNGDTKILTDIVNGDKVDDGKTLIDNDTEMLADNVKCDKLDDGNIINDNNDTEMLADIFNCDKPEDGKILIDNNDTDMLAGSVYCDKLDDSETVVNSTSTRDTHSMSSLSLQSSTTNNDSTQLLLDEVAQRLSFSSFASCSTSSDVNFLDDSYQDDSYQDNENSSCIDTPSANFEKSVSFLLGCDDDDDSDSGSEWSEDSDSEELDDEALRASEALWNSFTCNDEYHPMGGWQCSNIKKTLPKSSSTPNMKNDITISPPHATPQTTPQNEPEDFDDSVVINSQLNSADTHRRRPPLVGRSLSDRTESRKSPLFLCSAKSAPDLHSIPENVPRESTKSPKKKVRFADDEQLVKSHVMVVWQYAYKACRRGPWEEYARDRCRFERRIDDISAVLSPCLTPEHRNIMYNVIHQDI